LHAAVGEGELRAALQQQAAAAGLADHFSLPGGVADVLMKMTKISVGPTKENFKNCRYRGSVNATTCLTWAISVASSSGTPFLPIALTR